MNPPAAPRISMPCRLDHLAIARVTGADARSFLQGQLSIDLQRLTPQRLELASCNSPQGRVQAVLWLVERSDGIVLVLPTLLLEPTLARLRKYTMRAKVKIEAANDLAAFDAGTGDLAPRTHSEQDGVSLIGWPGPRQLMLAPAALAACDDTARQQAWRLADIRAGLPQVYPQTHETFVAQMLNLDQLDGISFEKGCYTGQEIIARAHFRGTVKRRMFHFAADGPPPEPGTRLLADETHAGEVVDAAATAEGCELLAVVSLAQSAMPLRLDGGTTALRRLG